MFNKLKTIYFNAPLKSRLVSLVVLLSIVLTILTTLLQAWFYYHESIKDLEANINLIQESNKEALEKAVWNLDTDQLTSILHGVLSYPNIHYIEFQSKDFDKTSFGNKTKSTWIIERSIPYYKNNIHLGNLYFYSDLKQSVLKELIHNGIFILLIQIIQYALLISLILIVVNKLILKTLMQLDNYTRNISVNLNELPEDINLDSNAPIEFQHLGNTIVELKNGLYSHIQSLKQYQENLEDLVNDRTRQLNQAVAKAEKANNSKSQFLSNVTHELKTPLNAIITLSKILGKNPQDHFDEKEVKKVKIINNAGHELLDLVNELLDLSKIEAGELNFNFKQINLTDLLNDIYDLLLPTAEMKGLSLINKINQNATVTTDPMRVAQIIKNILSNAIKFTTEGSVTMELVESKNENYKYIFRAIDTGIGIKESDLSKIFDRYQQLHDNTLDITPGTGLGLCISKMLSDRLLCDIVVSSNYGEGTIFEFYIKDLASIVDLDSDKSFIPEELVILKGKHIIIVDDDDDNIVYLKSILENRGAHITSYNNPEKLLKDISFLSMADIFLIDYKMPNMNGVNLANNIATHTKYNGAPIFILTNSTENNFVDIAKNSTVSIVLSKPINIKEFISAYRRTFLN